LSNSAPRPAGLLASGRTFLAALLEIGQTRLRLASTELEEERLRIAELLLLATVALFFIGIGLVLACMLVVLLMWDGPRELTLGLLSTAFLGLGAAAAIVWRRKARNKPALLAATLEELRRDQVALRPGPDSGDAR
jgi:uncharacterized membrane protein YqjE